MSDPKVTTVPIGVRRLLSLLERAARGAVIAFLPVLFLQINRHHLDVSGLQAGGFAAAGAALSVIMSALGLAIPGTNPATPSLLPAKYDPATPPPLTFWHEQDLPETTADPYTWTDTGTPAQIPPPGAHRPPMQTGHDPAPAGSSWTGPTVLEAASPWPTSDGSYDYLPPGSYQSGGELPPGLSFLGAKETEHIVTSPSADHPARQPAYGWKPQPPDPRDWHLDLASLPERYAGAYVDLTGGFPDSPYDQLQLGSCVSNGVAALIDFARSKQGLTPLRPPSRLFIYYEGRQLEGTVGEDSGLYVRDGIKVVATVGAPPETDYPYEIGKFTDPPTAQALSDAKLDVAVKYLAVSKSQIFDTVASGYPVVIGFNVPAGFEGGAIAGNGIMPLAAWLASKFVGGHCVVVVSTPKTVTDAAGSSYEAVRCRNSWSSGWGDGGYFWMPTQFLMGSNVSDCWMVSTLNDPAPQPKPQPTSDAFLTALTSYPGAIDELGAATTTHNRRRGENMTPEQYGAWLVAGALGAR